MVFSLTMPPKKYRTRTELIIDNAKVVNEKRASEAAKTDELRRSERLKRVNRNLSQDFVLLDINKKKYKKPSVKLCGRQNKAKYIEQWLNEGNKIMRLEHQQLRTLVEYQVQKIQEQEVQQQEIQEQEVQQQEIQEQEVQLQEIQEQEVQLQEIQEQEVQLQEIQEQDVQLQEIQEQEVQLQEIQEQDVQRQEIQEQEVQRHEEMSDGDSFVHGSQSDSDASEIFPMLHCPSNKRSQVLSDRADHDKMLPDSTMDAENVKTLNVEVTNNYLCRKYDKKYYCFYCDKPFDKLPRHWRSMHRNEFEVAQIEAEGNGRKKLEKIALLRNKGNHLHNCAVVREGKGTMAVKYRPKESESVEKYVPCEKCLGYFSKKDLYRHRCPASFGERNHTRVTSGCYLLPPCKKITPEFETVINEMHAGPVKRICISDSIIKKFGLKMYMKHGFQKKELSRNKMRELGRFLLEFRHISGSVDASLAYTLHPKHFRDVVKAVRVLAGFDSSERKYRNPSIALKLGHSLRKCCKILKGEGIEIDDRSVIDAAVKFEELCELNWSEEVSFHASRTLYERKRNAVKRLPLTEDTKCLIKYLKSEMSGAVELLTDEVNDINVLWRNLAEASLAYMIVFNRRRQGEVSRILVADYAKNKTATSANDMSTEIACHLSAVEKQLCTVFRRMEIPGKKGRTVAIFYDDYMQRIMDKLMQFRIQAGVHSSNIYLFACNNSAASGNIRGTDCLRKFSLLCGAKHPETLRSTQFRKHIATMSQILSLRNNELDMLAQWMGHDIRVHREYYRLPQDTLQLAKLSKLLLAMEKGTIQSGQDFDSLQVNFDLESEVEAEGESSDDELEENDDAVLCRTQRPVGKQIQESSAAQGKVCHKEFQNNVESNFDGIIEKNNKTDLKTPIQKIPNKQLILKPLNHMESNSDIEPSDDNEYKGFAQKHKTNKPKEFQNKRARKRKSLKLDSDNEVEEESSDGEGSRPRRKRGAIKQTRWSSLEREAVDEHFLKYILRIEVPRKEELESVLKRDKRLASRTWKNISDHIRNRIKARV